MDPFTKGVFITGTDTDVGKTVASAAVLMAIRGMGVNAVPMKPVQTGGIMRNGVMSSPDLLFCLKMAGLEPESDDCRRMSPYVFEPACSPHLAASLAGSEIKCELICEAFKELSKTYDCVVVEGAGGVLVPLSRETTALDLMDLLSLPVILVARPGLGTLNHTLLSLHELERAHLSILGVIFCATMSGDWGIIEEDNRQTIERMGKTRVLGCIPFMAGLAEGVIAPGEFFHSALQHLNLQSIRSHKR